MTDHTAQAEFVITSWEEDPVVADAAGSVSRTRVVKQFSGDIAGTSEAWLVMSVVDDSHMAYCGAERFDVTLDGRAGGFVLLHDADRGCLVALGSRGYGASGIGAKSVSIRKVRPGPEAMPTICRTRSPSTPRASAGACRSGRA